METPSEPAPAARPSDPPADAQQERRAMRPRQGSETTTRRPPLRERLVQALRSEVWRHGVAIMLMLAVTSVVQAAANQADEATSALTTVAAVPAAFGLYGVAYAVLTRLAFRRLRGRALKRALQASRPPRHPVARFLLGFGPRSWGVAIAAMALLGVIVLAISPIFRQSPLIVGGSIVCVIGTWILLVGVFAVEYARSWADRVEVIFPDRDESTRTMADFFYLSVQVATTFASSDVALRSRRMRSLVSVQSITAFAYSSVIVALLVSLLLSSLG